MSCFLWQLRPQGKPNRAKQSLTFAHNHREEIAAFDFFAATTMSFRTLYCFFVIEHGRRRKLEVTTHARCKPNRGLAACITATPGLRLPDAIGPSALMSMTHRTTYTVQSGFPGARAWLREAVEAPGSFVSASDWILTTDKGSVIGMLGRVFVFPPSLLMITCR